MSTILTAIAFVLLLEGSRSQPKMQTQGWPGSAYSDAEATVQTENTWKEFHMYDSKRTTTPTLVTNFRTAGYVRYKTTTPVGKRDVIRRILLFGGGSHYPSSTFQSLPKDTWVYTQKENSWFRLQLKLEPTGRTGHSLTTICENAVILFGGFDGKYHINDIWLFDGVNEVWKQISISKTAMKPSPRAFHSAAAFRSTGSCACQDSILIYGGSEAFHSLQNDLWELKCVRRRKEETFFTWIKHYLQEKDMGSLWPKPLLRHSAVFVDNATMLLGGGLYKWKTSFAPSHSFWLYNKNVQRWIEKTRTTNFVFFTFTQAFGTTGSLNMLPSYLLVYHPGVRKGLFLEFGKVFTFNATSERHWVEEKTIIDGATPNSRLFDFAAVVIDNKVLVFGGHDGSSQRRTISLKVWDLEQVAGDMWKWQLRHPEPNTYMSVAMFSWSLVSDKLIRSASISLPTGIPLKTLILKSFLPRLLVAENETPKSLMSGSILGNLLEDISIIISPVSYLDLDTQSLWQYVTSSENIPAYYAASTAFEDRAIVTYGGLTVDKLRNFDAKGNAFSVTTSHVCVYSVGHRRWYTTLSQSHIRDTPEGRLFPGIASIGNGSLILFGGLSVDGISSRFPINRKRFKFKNDMWILSIDRGWENYAETEIAVTWKEMIPSDKQKSAIPEGRFGHSSIFVDRKFVVSGGTTADVDTQVARCAWDLWYFNIDSKSWSKGLAMERTLQLFHTAYMCTAPVANVGNRILTINYTKPADNKTNRMDTGLMSSFPRNEVWIDFPFQLLFRPNHLFGWRERVVAIESEIDQFTVNVNGTDVLVHLVEDDSRFSIIKPFCPDGYVSENWTERPCNPCPIGQYADLGATSCDNCPLGLTTLSESSASSSNCSCSSGYCSHGVCFVAKKDGLIGAECVCHLGFTGANCQYPTYFIIAGTIAVGLAVITLLMIFLQQMIKFRKLKKMKDREIEQFGRVWNISPSELQLLIRIDIESPGCFGEVHKACYRDMTVAVKRLKDVMSHGPTERDFEREIQLMKSMRHPNLVLFFGAGRFEDNCPFLVVEFMQNGSLLNLLRNSDVSLSKSRQLQFCLDSALGIEFLHSQGPPRIHRDIKSSNLLLSEKWGVNVADFGSARLVKGQGVQQKVQRRKYHPNAIAMAGIPLLQANSNLSDDVFSGGHRKSLREKRIVPQSTYTVMWEIVARKAPFHGRGFRWIQDISYAVQSGIRPTMPNNVNNDYQSLVRDCWNTNPSRRPTSSEVVERLKDTV